MYKNSSIKAFEKSKTVVYYRSDYFIFLSKCGWTFSDHVNKQ